MFSNQQLKKILVKADILVNEDFDKYAKEAKALGKNIEHYLNEKK